jgi:putative cell wall-binding protein
MATAVRPSVRAALLRRLAVALLGAALALALLPPAAGAQDDDGSVTPARVSGESRFHTAAAIAATSFDAAAVAVLVTGEDHPDALAGSFAAGRLDAPILLAAADHVPAPTREVLEELGVDEVVLVGGEGAIGDEVVAALEDDGYEVERLAGGDRYQTAIAVAQAHHEGVDAGTLDGQRPALLASGEDFPDALSAGPVAARAGIPLLLTPRDRALPGVGAALEELGIERLIIAGGTGAVSEAVADAYREQGYTVQRLAGPTRTETATAVADFAIDRLDGFAAARVLLARGDDFPDALAASVHAALLGAPILLTADVDELSAGTRTWLGERCEEVDVIRALGGEGAVAESTLAAAVEAVERCLRGTQEVARFTTDLIGNPDRAHNIQRAADLIDGDVIPAGATYSLDDAIGNRSRARGFRYVENGCIGADGTAVGCVGGGVSQLATTFMNAVWLSGVRFGATDAQRGFQPHSIHFDRYPVCHEATISRGTIDVVVRNDSPYDLTIDTFYDAEDTFIGVRLISVPWAEVESWADPSSPPAGGGAFQSSCGRTMTYPDGTTRSETYDWFYEDSGGF